MRRSPEEKTVRQNGKSVKLDGKKITFWSPKTDQFENPSGIDAPFKTLVDIVPVLADTTTTDIVDFGATKTLGKLIAATSSEFQTTEKWKVFQEAHAAAFSADDNSFVSLTKNMTSQVEALVREQYGPAEVRLDFNLPEAATFIKGGQLLVKDGSYETPLSDKGTGMQRAITLALIQVYSQLQHEAKEHAPLTLLLDEPETWLHPRAQLQLSEALVRIAETEQLFLITHSPYMLRSYQPQDHHLLVFSRGDEMPEILESCDLGLLGRQGPSWGEITYFAFGIPSPEFHDELWGEVYRCAGCKSETKLNRYLNSTHSLRFSKQWQRDDTPGKDKEDATLPYYIRNSIHHPENTLNTPYTQDELSQSTEMMIGVLRALRNSQGK